MSVSSPGSSTSSTTRTRDPRLKLEQSLISAAMTNNLPEIQRLLDMGVNVNAAFVSNTALIYAVMNTQLEAMRELIARRADVNAANKNGETALIIAAKNGHVVAVREIIAADADVNATDKVGYTALSEAVYRRHIAVVRELLGNGADPFVQIRPGYYMDGFMPNHIAVKEEINQTLAAARETITAAREKGWSPERHCLFPRHVKEKVEALMIAWGFHLEGLNAGQPRHPESPLSSLPLELVFAICEQLHLYDRE